MTKSHQILKFACFGVWIGLLAGFSGCLSQVGGEPSEGKGTDKQPGTTGDQPNATVGRCGPENCDGCCQDDFCYTGITIEHCGVGGSQCAPCGSGEVCEREGHCAAGTGTGNTTGNGSNGTGSGGTGSNPPAPACGNKCKGADDGAGGVCPENTCNGCCTADKKCNGGKTHTFCGPVGGACENCLTKGDGWACDVPTRTCKDNCKPSCDGKCAGQDNGCGKPCTTAEAKCDGCCSTNGDICRKGTTNSECGSNGANCSNCLKGGGTCELNTTLNPDAYKCKYPPGGGGNIPVP